MDGGLLTDLVALLDKVSGIGFDRAAPAELLGFESALEDLARRIPAVEHRLLAALTSQTTPAELGAKSWAEVLQVRMLISPPPMRTAASPKPTPWVLAAR